MWELDCEESWAPKNWCFWTVVLEKTLESPLDCKEIQPVHPKGDQSWVFTGRTDAEAETPILWPPHGKSWPIGKDPDAGRDWELEEKGMTENEMVGWHLQLDGHEFCWTPGVGDGQGGLACCSSWGRKESDTTEWLNWTELKHAERNFIKLSSGFFIKSFSESFLHSGFKVSWCLYFDKMYVFNSWILLCEAVSVSWQNHVPLSSHKDSLSPQRGVLFTFKGIHIDTAHHTKFIVYIRIHFRFYTVYGFWHTSWH